MLKELKRHLPMMVAISAFLAGFAWLVLRPHEPLYQGQPLRVWLAMSPRTGWYTDPAESPRVRYGNRDLAVSLLPEVVRLAGTPRTIPRMVLGEMAREESFAFLHLPPQNGKYELALWVCKMLGPEARSVVPGLAGLLQRNDPWVRVGAARCLGAIGPAAAEAVPALIAAFSRATKENVWQQNSLRSSIAEALGQMGSAAEPALPYLAADTNEVFQLAVLRIKGESLGPFLNKLKNTADLRRWSQTAVVVGRMGTNAMPAIPLLLPLLNQTNRTIPQSSVTIHEQTLDALAQIHSQADLCVPAIMPSLGSSNLNVRMKALLALQAFGPAAQSAVPQILVSLKDPAQWIRGEATNTLREVDPATAARMGIKTR